MAFDRSPQFRSQAWKAFCTDIGAKPCLVLGTIPNLVVREKDLTKNSKPHSTV